MCLYIWERESVSSEGEELTKITALKQDPEKQPWSDGAIELFRVMQESCAKNNMATSPEPCVWQNRDPFIPSSPVSGWWHGPSGRLSQDWSSHNQRLYGRPCRLLFLLAAFLLLPEASARSPHMVLLRRAVFALLKSFFARYRSDIFLHRPLWSFPHPGSLCFCVCGNDAF